MFDLSKIFDLSKKFALPDTFHKSKNYCTTNQLKTSPKQAQNKLKTSPKQAQNRPKTSPKLKFCSIKMAHIMTYT